MLLTYLCCQLLFFLQILKVSWCCYETSFDIASLTKTTFTFQLLTAYWRLIILSWANSRLGVPDLLNCQSWLSLPDILLFVLLCFWKKRVSRFWLVWVTFLWKIPKGAVLWSGVLSIVILRIFTIRKLSSFMQWFKEKDLSVGYCEGLYLVKNQFVTAKWCMWIVVS